MVEPADWFLFITHFFPVTKLGSLIANTCLNLSRIGNIFNGVEYHGMLKQQTWSEIKEGAAQQRPPTVPAHEHWTPCWWISPPLQSLQVVSVWPPPMMPSYAFFFFLPMFKAAAINSLARKEMSHSLIAEVGEWEGLQDKELWRLKRNRGETRCNY